MSQDLTGVRAEDLFDVEAMQAWLSQQIPDLSGLPKVSQFRSGASNLTYLLEYPDHQLVLRKPPRGTKAISAHDMKREVHIQRSLRPAFPLVPKIFAFCDDVGIIGSPFYVMERIQGTILRRDLPADIELPEEMAAELGDKVIDGLVLLHKIDARILQDLNKGSGYVARQVEGWSTRYRNALTDDVPDADQLMSWLKTHQPADSASCVLHGDWRLDNMVFDLTNHPRLVGVLDWELATVGDPLMDLGSSMAYWIDKDDPADYAALRRQPTHLPGMSTRSEFIEKYLNRSNSACTDFTFYEVFGLFRLAVILQQIWARYRKGETTNPAFSGFGSAINVLINRASSLS